MRKRLLLICCLVAVMTFLSASFAEAEDVKTSKRKRGKAPSKNPISATLTNLLAPTAPTEQKAKEVLPSTHQQTRLIELKTPRGGRVQMHALAIDSKGRLLAACGGTRTTRSEAKDGPKVVTETQPGEIRVYSPEGDLETTWSLEVAPQALSIAEDGTIFVAGYEKIMKLSAEGKQLAVADLPHAELLENSKEKIREDVKASIKRQKEMMQKYVDQQTKRIKTLSEKEELTKAEELQLKQAKMMQKSYGRYLKDDNDTVNQRVLATINSKKKVSSLAVSNGEVYVATNDVVGYGFCIWRLNESLDTSKKIVTNLRGCCGNMHIGAGNCELFVAENARHRVCRYDREGKLIKTFGKKDREGLEGFASCCNPMNVCITGKGEVYTSESNVGRIKRYSADGEYLELVGAVDLVPGCKNVSIVVSKDNSRVYMMDMTRSHIIVMEKKKEEKKKEPGVASVK